MKYARKALFLLVILLIAVPALAQETTPTIEVLSDVTEAVTEVAATVAPIPADTPTTPAEPETLITVWLPIAAFASLTIALLGVIYLANEGLKSARVNISPESIQALAQPLYEALQRQMTNANQLAERTPSPLDNIALDLASLPLDALFTELGKRGYIVKESDPGNPPDATPNFADL